MLPLSPETFGEIGPGVTEAIFKETEFELDNRLCR
jgi:hypothetical protein